MGVGMGITRGMGAQGMGNTREMGGKEQINMVDVVRSPGVLVSWKDRMWLERRGFSLITAA